MSFWVHGVHWFMCFLKHFRFWSRGKFEGHAFCSIDFVEEPGLFGVLTFQEKIQRAPIP